MFERTFKTTTTCGPPCGTSLVDGLADRRGTQNAIRRLMRPDDMLVTFSELAVKVANLMRPVLQASVATLINGQSWEAFDAEMMRRAVPVN